MSAVEQEPTLRALLREDWETHSRSFTAPGLHALALHRVSTALRDRPGVLARLLRRACHTVNVLLVRNVYGMEVYETAVIGRRLKIVHHMGVLIGRGTVIGNDCIVRQHVTLGQLSGARMGVDQEPRLGDRVILGVGCSVLGPVTIGDGARVGPHALVLKDVPAGATAMASPARALPKPAD